MFLRVHYYNLKKKRCSHLVVGRNDNYDLKIKKEQLSGGFIITSKKKRAVGMFGGVPRARMFWRVHNYDLKKKKVQSSGGW